MLSMREVAASELHESGLIKEIILERYGLYNRGRCRLQPIQ